MSVENIIIEISLKFNRDELKSGKLTTINNSIYKLATLKEIDSRSITPYKVQVEKNSLYNDVKYILTYHLKEHSNKEHRIKYFSQKDIEKLY